MALVKPHGFHRATTVGEGLDLAKDLLFGALLNGHDEADHCLTRASSGGSSHSLMQISSGSDVNHNDPGVPRRAACKPESCPFFPAGLNA